MSQFEYVKDFGKKNLIFLILSDLTFFITLITFFGKNYWGLIRDEYLGKNFNQIHTVPTHKKNLSHNKHTY